MLNVMLDPGHGGDDPGAVYGNLKEKDITLKIALYAEEFLKKNYDVNVKMTRNNDVSVSLKQRTKMANKFKADLFVSIHVNSHEEGTGFESFIYLKTPDETLQFQKVLHNEIQEFYNQYNILDRGKKRNDLYVLKHTKMSAILTENLFIQKDGKYLKNETFLKQVGEAHARGIADTLRLSKK